MALRAAVHLDRMTTLREKRKGLKVHLKAKINVFVKDADLDS